MSAMGQMVFDIEERYAGGEDPKSIAAAVKMPLTFVLDVIRQFEESWNEPNDGDFS